MEEAQFTPVSQVETNGNGNSNGNGQEKLVVHAVAPDDDEEELNEFIHGLGGKPTRRLDSSASGGAVSGSKKAVAVVLAVLALIVFGLGSFTGSTFRNGQNGNILPGQRFLGNYTDPNHPDGTRAIILRPDQGVLKVIIVGRDAPGAPTWVAPVKPISSQVIYADFSSKHGPSALRGDLQTNGDILWQDNNIWRRIVALPFSKGGD